MEKFKFAIIGCGRISYKHVEAIINNEENAQLVAVCDPILALAEEKKEQYESHTNEKTVHIYADYKDMLNKEDIDIISICTESGYHAEISIYCMEKRKHVIVEKPMALSISDADAMIACAENNSVILSVSHQNRFNKSIQILRSAIEEKRFGKIFNGTARILWCRDDNYYNQAPWRGTWELDGGALMNQCIHNIDLLIWSIGDEIDTVFSMCNNFKHNIEAEDFGAILIRFKNGCIGTVEGSVCVYPQNLEETLSIFGNKGTVIIGGIAVNQIQTWEFGDQLDRASTFVMDQGESPDSVYGFGHTALYKNMIDSVRNETKPLICGREGKKAVEVILAAYKSQLTDSPVKFPLCDFSTLDMESIRYPV